jgi:tetratricopeptide (TPR) repeat protein
MDDSAPNENAVRHQIDKLIKDAQDGKKKATLGLIQETISLSISFGAPTYNLGDRESCFRFYAKTAKTLCAAFPDEVSASAAGRRSILDLKAALGRAAASPDVDRNAWAMRYAFDKTQLALSTHAGEISGLVQMGSEYFKRGQIDEAADAFAAAVGMLDEFEGQPAASVPADCRFAPLGLANAQFATKKYKEAVGSITAGLKLFPTWPAVKLDLRGLHRDPADYEDTLADLEQQAKADEKDAALQFLLGYEYHFSGKRAVAREQFEKTLKADPENANAKLFLKQLDAPKPEKGEKDNDPEKKKTF